MESASSKPLSKDTASYTCTAKQEIKFNNKNVTKYQYEMKMTISDVQIQAFDVNNTFSTGWFNIRHLYLQKTIKNRPIDYMMHTSENMIPLKKIISIYL